MDKTHKVNANPRNQRKLKNMTAVEDTIVKNLDGH